MNIKKETSGRDKMGQELQWATVVYPLKELNNSELQERNKWQAQNCSLLLFTTWKSQTNGEQQERNKWQCQDRPRVNMGQDSKLAKGQDGLLLLTTWKSRTNSDQQERNKL